MLVPGISERTVGGVLLFSCRMVRRCGWFNAVSQQLTNAEEDEEEGELEDEDHFSSSMAFTTEASIVVLLANRDATKLDYMNQT